MAAMPATGAPPQDDAAMILDDWTATVTGLDLPLTRSGLDSWQWRRLAETLAFARAASPFYRRQPGWPRDLPADWTDFRRLPFTTAADLAAGDPPLVALSEAEIAHGATLPTSGTEAAPKPVPFTAEEREATMAAFSAGMAVFTRPGDTVLVAFPGERSGSIGEGLVTAVARIGARPVLVPWSLPPLDLGRRIALERADVVAGPPVRLLAAARSLDGQGWALPRVRAVLSSADRLTASLRAALQQIWQAEVFDHWGMTETGLAGAIECARHDGLHLDETNILAEIVDPETGAPRPDGQTGELVVTTLRRRALPLIRYRTGDLAAITRAPCRCGSRLARLKLGDGRVRAGYRLPQGCLTRGALDEALFAVEGVTDFSAAIRPGEPPQLSIRVGAPDHWRRPKLLQHCRAALQELPLLNDALLGGALTLDLAEAATAVVDATGKRQLRVET